MKLIIGSRASDLALWQANHIKTELEKQNPDVSVEIKIVKTKGDVILDVALSKIGDKGLFTKELELELLKGGIDLAVHSLKDLQTRIPDGLRLAAVTRRHAVEDVLIARKPNLTLQMLPLGGTVATGSLRRRSQLKHLRPDLNIVELRGNVPTRVQKFLDSEWDAIILARAGVERLHLEHHVSSIIPVDQMLPAVGQGALALEINMENEFAQSAVQALHDKDTFAAISAERALLRALEGGCQVPIGAYGEVEGNALCLTAMVAALDGSELYRLEKRGEKGDPESLGKALAEDLVDAGAGRILDEIFKAARA
jgi:hydroxymethylbilane synthase